MATKAFKHLPCNEQLKITSAEPKADDIVVCPKCGLEVTYETFQREIREYLLEQTQERLSKPFKDAARNSKHMKFTEGHRPKKAHRFVVEGGLF